MYCEDVLSAHPYMRGHLSAVTTLLGEETSESISKNRSVKDIHEMLTLLYACTWV